MKVKYLVLVMILFSVTGCAQFVESLGQTLNQMSEGMIEGVRRQNLEDSGYSADCVSAARQMYAEGKLSDGEYQFLVSTKCKKPPKQNIQQTDCNICPRCGGGGFIEVIGGTFHRRCVMGHIWPSC